MSADGIPALSAADLRKSYRMHRRDARYAVDGVSFRIPAATTVGLMGASGSGKSTIARMLLGLEAPDSGEVRMFGQRVELSRAGLAEVRRQAQMVFQDPYSSFDPRMTVGESVVLTLGAHGIERAARKDRALEALERVGLSRRVADSRPRQLSGGQLQRASIARALAIRPKILILDEPVAALDKSVQALVINLLEDLQADLALTYLFISHDLAVIEHVSDEIVVLSAGKIADQGDRDWIFRRSEVAYTRSLRDAIAMEADHVRA